MTTAIYPAPIFGPVLSRRLGISLGVNLLPPDGKLCNFDCIYCECGTNCERRPQSRMSSKTVVLDALEQTLSLRREKQLELDAITFSGNGEPTAHPDFCEIVDGVIALRNRFYPKALVCVLTNATRVMEPNIRAALLRVDRACLKLDAVSEDYIRRVDRPTSRYDVADAIEAMKAFHGKCVIQSMFLHGTLAGKSVDNTKEEYVGPWVDAIKKIAPQCIDLYTISRETPIDTLLPVGRQELEEIAQRLRAAGLKARCFCG